MVRAPRQTGRIVEGAPNTAMNPSPRNLLMSPRRSMASIVTAETPFRNVWPGVRVRAQEI
jgi:hypothetical protein